MRTIILLATLCLCAPAFAAPVPKELRKETFEGSWRLESVRLGSRPPIRFKELFWTIGETGSVNESPATDKETVLLTPPKRLIFDPKRNAVSVVFEETIWFGIYKWDGDTLTLCIGRDENNKPAAIKATDTTRIITISRSVDQHTNASLPEVSCAPSR